MARQPQLSYNRLSITEREILYKSLAEGKAQKDIAKELNRHPSTISREIRKGGMNKFSYRPSLSQKFAERESLKRRRKYKLVEGQALSFRAGRKNIWEGLVPLPSEIWENLPLKGEVSSKRMKSSQKSLKIKSG